MDPRERFVADAGALEERIAAALGRIAVFGRRELDRAASRAGQSSLQALVLRRLERLGPAAVGEIARQLDVRPPTLTDAIAALERKGLLERRRGEDDRRVVEIHPTPRGLELARELETWPDVLRRAVSVLAPPDRGVLLRLLLQLIAQLVREGRVRDARMCVTCRYFRPHAHPGEPLPHHCALVDLPLSDEHLRHDCPDHEALEEEALSGRLARLGSTP